MKIHTIFFDLDDTLYPSSSGLWPQIGQRIELYMRQKLNLPPDEITLLRKSYHRQYGTTLRGLQAVYGIDMRDYLDFVHDIPLADFICPEPGVREMLLALPQRRLIFTNADRNHAGRVLKVLGLSDCFELIIDILDIAPYCKPQPEAFEIAMRLAGIPNPQGCMILDDTLHNLAGAQRIGFATVLISPNPVMDGLDGCITRLGELPSAIRQIEASA